MDAASVIGTVALIAVGATALFIWSGKDIPDQWWTIVVAAVILKLFGKNGNNGNGS